MRGNPAASSTEAIEGGSIPAYAGEPKETQRAVRPEPVYPRVCGGTGGGGGGAFAIGSIPAYAGEPHRGSAVTARRAVYPRVCGGTRPIRSPGKASAGLSPRMRGNRGRRWRPRSWRRSIPAYAGEPYAEAFQGAQQRVYPRVCGGTTRRSRMPSPVMGLSPRMRGNRMPRLSRGPSSGSIPAYAGEPLDDPGCRPRSWVYPRVCGGTRRRPRVNGGRNGLSPRMRGNPSIWRCMSIWRRSIPAYAGEPAQSDYAGRDSMVYPRVCGGTSVLCSVMTLLLGLSPRMRGNRRCPLLPPLVCGSIPAYAGEPPASPDSDCQSAVYPRVCGGTDCPSSQAGTHWGLSPRMRGNRLHRWRQSVIRGSIPAYAGEPVHLSGVWAGQQVYPRVCGGTQSASPVRGDG